MDGIVGKSAATGKRPVAVSIRSTQSLLMVAFLCYAMGQFIIFAVLAPLIRSVGLAEYQGGLILSCSAVIFALSSGVWGRISEVIGRKRVILIGLAGYCGGTLLFAAIFGAGLNGWLSGGFLFSLLVISRMLQSTLMGAIPPASLAYMADITTPENRVRGMSLLGSANSLGTILGPTLAAPLLLLALLAPLLAGAGFAALAAVLIAWRLPARPALNPTQSIHIGIEIKRTLAAYFDRRYSLTLLIGVGMFVSYSVCQQTFGYLLQDRLALAPQAAASAVAHAFIASAVAALGAQLCIVTPFKPAPHRLLLIGLPLMALGFGWLIQLQAERDAILAFASIGLGLGLSLPGFSASASLSVPANEQGAISGIIGGAPALGYIVGPTLGAVLYQLHAALPYISAVLINFALIVLVWRQRRTKHGYGHEDAH